MPCPDWKNTLEGIERFLANGREEHELRGREDHDLSSPARAREAVYLGSEQRSALRVAYLINKTIYLLLLVLFVLMAVPYGTVEPWWKAFFVCFIFGLCIIAIIESFLSGSVKLAERTILIPLFALVALALLQSMPLSNEVHPGIPHVPWNAISADPYQTQFFALQLLALTLAGALLYRYASTDRRVRILINVIIAVAIASAIFGVLRQTNQHGVGFGLPLLQPGRGYGQFINPNHFALLMEMAFGLVMGIILGGGARREWALIYVASLIVVWAALVLSNSRGGLVAMLAQIIVGLVLVTLVVPASKAEGVRFRVFRVLRAWPVRMAVLMLLLAGVVMGTLWIGGDRLASRFEDVSGDLNGAQTRQGGSRNEIWRATWQMFKAHPIAGVGMGGYWAAIPAYHDASGTLTPQEAHNEYLELLASGGIIGAAIGAWFLFVVFSRIRSNLRSPNRFRRAARYGAVLGLVGVAIHSLFDFGLHMLVNALVCAALIVIATRKGHSEQKHRRSNA